MNHHQQPPLVGQSDHHEPIFIGGMVWIADRY